MTDEKKTVSVEIPKRWMLVEPCGCIDGVCVGARSDGTVHCATEEQAWSRFYERNRDRERDQKRGYTIRAEGDGDWELFRLPLTEQHSRHPELLLIKPDAVVAS
jgi:hypothetical protein